jgi:hypothetical protein
MKGITVTYLMKGITVTYLMKVITVESLGGRNPRDINRIARIS